MAHGSKGIRGQRVVAIVVTFPTGSHIPQERRTEDKHLTVMFQATNAIETQLQTYFMREYGKRAVANRINGAGGWHTPGKVNLTYIYIDIK